MYLHTQSVHASSSVVSQQRQVGKLALKVPLQSFVDTLFLTSPLVFPLASRGEIAGCLPSIHCSFIR